MWKEAWKKKISTMTEISSHHWQWEKHTSWTFKNHITVWLLGDKIRARLKHFRMYHAYYHCCCYYLLPERFLILHGSADWHDVKKVTFFFSKKSLGKNRNRETIEKQWYSSSLHDSNPLSLYTCRVIEEFQGKGVDIQMFSGDANKRWQGAQENA